MDYEDGGGSIKQSFILLNMIHNTFISQNPKLLNMSYNSLIFCENSSLSKDGFEIRIIQISVLSSRKVTRFLFASKFLQNIMFIILECLFFYIYEIGLRIVRILLLLSRPYLKFVLKFFCNNMSALNRVEPMASFLYKKFLVAKNVGTCHCTIITFFCYLFL